MNIAMNLLALSPVITAVIVVVAVLVCAGVLLGVVLGVKARNKKSKGNDGISITSQVRPVAEAEPDLYTKPSDDAQASGEAGEYDKLNDELEEVSAEIDRLTEEIADAEEYLPETEPKTEETVEVAEESVEASTKEEEVTAEEPVEEVAEVVEEKPEVVSQPIVIHRKAPEGKVFVRVRYNRSYVAKIIQSDEVFKNYYTELRNEVMKYKVHDRISWRHETFRKGRKLLIRFAIRGKTLNVYFALDPAQYADTKYKVKDVSSVARNAAVPTLYKIKNDRRCRYAKDLIAQVMAENELAAGEEQNVNYAAQYPYEELEPLIERRLVKLLQWEETSEEAEEGIIALPVEEIPAEIAATAVEVVEEEPVEEVAEEVEEKPEVVSQPIVIHRKAPEGKVFVRVRYNRSYIAKIIQSDEVFKNYYTELRNEVMKYKVHDRISWRHETFRKGRKLLIRFAIRGKTLNVYFALDPAQYADTKYKVKDVSSVARNAAVPTLYKIKNDRRCRYAKDLIAQVMAENELAAGEEQNVNYAAQYPYEELEPLIERRLVKLLQWEETSEEAEEGIIALPVEEIPAEIAATAVEVVEEEEAPAEEPVEEVAEVITEEPAEEVQEVTEEIPEEEVEEEAEEVIAQPFDEDEDNFEDFFNEFEDEQSEEPEESADVEISFDEAEEILEDRYVEAFVKQGSKYADKSKKGIINVDVLGRYFQKGERVTVEEIKKRVKGFDRKVTYLKVLGRGTLDKALTVEADDFSPTAIKMIVLTGGEVIRTKRT